MFGYWIFFTVLVLSRFDNSNCLLPTRKPSIRPSSKPTVRPTQVPIHPTKQPTNQPSTNPSRQPTSQPSIQPSKSPSILPSSQPIGIPSRQPSFQPSTQPTCTPSTQPSSNPSQQPNMRPSGIPTVQPSIQPTRQPSMVPSSYPSKQPSSQPSIAPSSHPSGVPTEQPIARPSCVPSFQPSVVPTKQPNSRPSSGPSCVPTVLPSNHPSINPSSLPTLPPSRQPSKQPSSNPVSNPSKQPSYSPSRSPSCQPTFIPSNIPTSQPLGKPSKQPSAQPSKQPSKQPVSQPSKQPSTQPSTFPSNQPTLQPTKQPSAQPSKNPTQQPLSIPTRNPSSSPSKQPSRVPTTQPSAFPSRQPSLQPTRIPSSLPTRCPSRSPTSTPTKQPSLSPFSRPTMQPTSQPNRIPTKQPSTPPTQNPTVQPFSFPTKVPSSQPTQSPSSQPSQQPTKKPSEQPTRQPTLQPYSKPSMQPSKQPQSYPSANPTCQPTGSPTNQPARRPSSHPSNIPSARPSLQPTKQPTNKPSRQPLSFPSTQPSDLPSSFPTFIPSVQPTHQPTRQNSVNPTSTPTNSPSNYPTLQPSCLPTTQPFTVPSSRPSNQPTVVPSNLPTTSPSNIPTNLPTIEPSSQPSISPSLSPSQQPLSRPTSTPSKQPTGSPTIQPSTEPSSNPSSFPSISPSVQPTIAPSVFPSKQPFSFPTISPSGQPTCNPTLQPSAEPSSAPTNFPSAFPTDTPSINPTSLPTKLPTKSPSSTPSNFPSNLPTYSPSCSPSLCPSSQPSDEPSCNPSVIPSNLPSERPSTQPSVHPSSTPSIVPSAQPGAIPSTSPSQMPSYTPSKVPTNFPSMTPSAAPTDLPSAQPSSFPSNTPSYSPTAEPSNIPSVTPSAIPSISPSIAPSNIPSSVPSVFPSDQPSVIPSMLPTVIPSSNPSVVPSCSPSNEPSNNPTIDPTATPNSKPSSSPSAQPVVYPSASPTSMPSCTPSRHPSCIPTTFPTNQPTIIPTTNPTMAPTVNPTFSPTSQPSNFPSSTPSMHPSLQPLSNPTCDPSTIPTVQPSTNPSTKPSSSPSIAPTMNPSSNPTNWPTSQPSSAPHSLPTEQPSNVPISIPSTQPSNQPSIQPHSFPTADPTCTPSQNPTSIPTTQPINPPSSEPSSSPSIPPTAQPFPFPSNVPSKQPSNFPTIQPSGFPSIHPSCAPLSYPTNIPSKQPISLPTKQPSIIPSIQPSVQPVVIPSNQPSSTPSMQPSNSPFSFPTIDPTVQPTQVPSNRPSSAPTTAPTFQPNRVPSSIPSIQPTSFPTNPPSHQPFSIPTSTPTNQPIIKPSNQPSQQPTRGPLSKPSAIPSMQPQSFPTCQPTSSPTNPTSQPTSCPTTTPTETPSLSPNVKPSKQPSSQPSIHPSNQPTNLPSSKPTLAPLTSIPSTSSPLIRGVKRTYRPTILPSSFPSSVPSASPTSTPTLNIESKWIESFIDLSLSISNSVSELYNILQFNELLTDHKVQFGGRSAWNSFCFVSLRNPFIFKKIESIQMYSRLSYQVDFNNHSCNNATIARSIVSALLNEISDKKLNFTFPCDANIWIVSSCSSLNINGLCVNCEDPCFRNNFTHDSALGYNCSHFDNCGNLIAVIAKQDFPPAKVTNILVGSQLSTSIDLIVNTSFESEVFCGAFPMGSQAPIQTSLLLLNNHNYSNGGVSNLRLNNLIPNTSYSIYCMAQSVTGATSSPIAIAQNLVHASTACCKTISVWLSQTLFYPNCSIEEAVQIVVNYPPISSIMFHIAMTLKNSLPYQSLCTFSPIISLTNQSLPSSLSQTIDVKCGGNIEEGTYDITLLRLDSSAETFQIEYPLGDTITIRKTNNFGLGAPKFQSAQFDNLGNKIILKFDRDTNQAELPTSFICKNLLQFVGVEKSTCLWKNYNTIIISLPTLSNLMLNDSIKLSTLPQAAASKLTALCTLQNSCSNLFSIQTGGLIRIENPSNPIKPNVVLNGPSTINNCQTLQVDLSSTVGHTGRNWHSVNVEVIPSSHTNTSAIKTIIMKQLMQGKNLLIFPPFTFPSENRYNVRLTLCNIFEQCDTGTYFLTVLNHSIPQISIAGVSALRLPAYQNISLSAIVSRSSCSCNVKNLSISWGVYYQNVYIERFSSSSIDPYKFILSAYKLKIGISYQIKAKITSPDGFLSAYTQVEIIVITSPLVAIISGGNKVGIMSQTSVLLDGSFSYDPDLSPSFQANDKSIYFLWTCQYIGIHGRAFCPITFLNDTILDKSILFVTSSKLFDGDDMIMSMTIFKGDRQSTTQLTLITQTDHRCMVGILTTLTSSVNTFDKLKLTSSVTFVEPSLFVWSINDNRNLNLSDMAYANPSEYFKDTSFSSSTISFDLLLTRYALFGGRSYTFQLSCLQNRNGILSVLSYATIDVLITSPPTSGLFQISPIIGHELLTSFLFSCHFWISDHLPLSYSFVFISPSSNNIISINSKNVVAYVSTILPAGNEFEESVIQAIAYVFDNAGSNTSIFSTVTVLSNNQLLDASWQGFDKLSEDSSSDQIRQFLGVYASSFYGDFGNANTLCFISTSFSSSRRLVLVDDIVKKCDSRINNCDVFENCVQGICVIQNKTCSPLCQQGLCIYRSYETNSPVDICLANDYSCYATCNCYRSFYGIDCSYTIFTQQSKSEKRNELIQKLQFLLKIDNPSVDTILSWISLLVSLTERVDQLTADSSITIISLINFVTARASEANISMESTSGLISATDALQAYSSNIYPGATIDIICSFNFTVWTELVESISSLIASDMVISQSFRFISHNLRFSITSFRLNSNHTFEEPVTITESILINKIPTIIQYRIIKQSTFKINDWATIGFVTWKKGLFRNSSFNSNPAVTYILDYNTNINHSQTHEQLFVQINNIKSIDTTRQTPNNISTVCENRRVITYEYVCPGGMNNLSISCNGSAGIFKSSCPSYYYTSSCNSLDQSNHFTTISYNNNTIICAIFGVLYIFKRKLKIKDDSTVDFILNPSELMDELPLQAIDIIDIPHYNIQSIDYNQINNNNNNNNNNEEMKELTSSFVSSLPIINNNNIKINKNMKLLLRNEYIMKYKLQEAQELEDAALVVDKIKKEEILRPELLTIEQYNSYHNSNNNINNNNKHYINNTIPSRVSSANLRSRNRIIRRANTPSKSVTPLHLADIIATNSNDDQNNNNADKNKDRNRSYHKNGKLEMDTTISSDKFSNNYNNRDNVSQLKPLGINHLDQFYSMTEHKNEYLDVFHHESKDKVISSFSSNSSRQKRLKSMQKMNSNNNNNNNNDNNNNKVAYLNM
eukprot:gene9204-12414_t